MNEIHTSAHFRIQRVSTSADCSLNPSASLQLTAAIKKPANTKGIPPCQPHATPGPSSCPNGGGDLALALRRSVRERCVCCATQVTPRALLFICETELRYAQGSKARSVQSDMSTRADKRQLHRAHIGCATLCPLPLQKRGRSCMPLACQSPLPPVSLRYYHAATCEKESRLELGN